MLLFNKTNIILRGAEMKILVFGERYFNFTDSTAYALNKLGHEVQIFYMNMLYNTKLGFVDHIKYKLKNKEFINNFYKKQKEELNELIDKFKPDMLLSINGNSYVEYIDKYLLLKLKKQKCKSVLWFMDTIKRFEHIPQNIDLFDEVLSFEPNDVMYIKNKYNIDIKYFPIGVAEELYCSGSKINEKIYDICFVGNTTENRLEVLNKIAEYCQKNDKKMIVYGHYWHNKHWWQEIIAKRKFSKKYPILSKYMTNELLNGKQVAELYSKSKICLNIHISLHKGINPRTFEILGNGNFQLCDYREDASSLGLVDGENIVLYKNTQECLNKIDYYLSNIEAREKVGENGANFVKDKYTISHLFSEFLEDFA